MPHLCLSLDIDSISEYAAIHGIQLDAEDPLFMYRWPLRRFVDLCEDLSVPGTLFVVTRDVTATAQDTLGHLAQQGFELASHSHIHDYRMSERKSGSIFNELRHSLQVIERKTGAVPVGFRAPGYTMSCTLADELEALGLSYSSSILPSPPYFAAKLAVLSTYWLSQRRSTARMGSPKLALAPTQPFRPGKNPHEPGDRSYVELPVAVAPPLRLPVVGAALLLAPQWLRHHMLRALEDMEVVVVNFHTMDFVDLEEAPLPAAIAARQPEIRRPIAEREKILRQWLRELARTRAGSTCATVAQSVRARSGLTQEAPGLKSSATAQY